MPRLSWAGCRPAQGRAVDRSGGLEQGLGVRAGR